MSRSVGTRPSVTSHRSDAAGLPVALLCPEARLRRILRIALQRDGYDVVEWSAGSAPPTASVAAVVVDLDGLRRGPSAALAILRAWGVDDATATLLISVYPPELDRPDRAGPLDYLQPPFGPREFAVRLGALLDGLATLGADRPATLRPGDPAARPAGDLSEPGRVDGV